MPKIGDTFRDPTGCRWHVVALATSLFLVVPDAPGERAAWLSDADVAARGWTPVPPTEVEPAPPNSLPFRGC